MVRKRKIKERDVSAKQFAGLAGVTEKTVRGYCLQIYSGNQRVLDELSRDYGLISVERLPNRWSMRVREMKK